MKTVSTVLQNIPKNWEDHINREIIPIEAEKMISEFHKKSTLEDLEMVRAIQLLKEKFSGVIPK